MAGKLDLLLEAERRGILPAPQMTLLEEARRRGLLPGAPAAATAAPAPAPLTLPDNGPLRSPLNDPMLSQGITQGASQAVAGASPLQPDEASGTGALAFGRGMARRLGNNILATPEVIADTIIPRLLPRPEQPGMIPDPLQLLSRGISGVTDAAVDPTAAAERLRARVAGGGHVVDLPDTSDIAAGIDVASQVIPETASRLSAAAQSVRGPIARFPGQSPGPIAPAAAPAPGAPIGDRFRQAQTDQMVTDIEMGQAAPFATGAGEIAGDIATLAGGRSLLRGGVPLQKAGAMAAERAQTILGRAMQSTGRVLQRAGGRAAEAGAEGAFLAMIQEDDPLQVGAIAAGGQAVGDMARPTFLKLIKPKNLFTAIGVATIVSLGAQQLTPGGLDRILPTIEAKNKAAILALLLTGSAGVLTGRIPKDFAGPAFAEIASLIPRGTLLSVLNSYAKDSARVGPVLDAFAQDPDHFGPKARRLLERALTTDGLDLGDTLDRLMEEREFRTKFNALTAPANP